MLETAPYNLEVHMKIRETTWPATVAVAPGGGAGLPADAIAVAAVVQLLLRSLT